MISPWMDVIGAFIAVVMLIGCIAVAFLVIKDVITNGFY